MEQFKGTPAPWHISIPKWTGKWAGFNTKGGTCIGIYATNDDLEAIALVPKDVMLSHSVQDNLANAVLISAAPELLYSLQSLIYLIEELNVTESLAVEHAKTIINKALGIPNNLTDPDTQAKIEEAYNNHKEEEK